MTLQEAYQFLDLPENATQAMLATRYREKEQFFRMLHENAPNPVIRKLQEKNLQALADIRTLVPGIAGVPDGNGAASGQQPSPQQRAQPSTHAQPVAADGVLAWLVVHTEGQRTQSFPLYEGENPVGRQEVAGKPSLLIMGDNFVSRFHCTLIIAYAKGELAAAIADDGRYSNGRLSLNGTYYNGRDARLKMQRLQENDTVQIGRTKLVFKWNQSSLRNIEEDVTKSDFVRTIVVDL